MAAYFAEGGPPPSLKVEPYLAEFPAQFAAYLLAEDGGTVGFAGLRVLEPGVGEVKRLYVVPSHRRRGVARALMAACVSEARAIGFHTLRLDTPATSAAAIALYESLDWRPIPPWDHGEEMVAFERSL